MKNNTTIPLREPKKRGRPKGSKNKKKMKRQKQIEAAAAAAANNEFERAFQNIPAIDNIGRIKERTDDNVNDNSNDDNDKLEETETFGMNLLPVGVIVDEEESPLD